MLFTTCDDVLLKIRYCKSLFLQYFVEFISNLFLLLFYSNWNETRLTSSTTQYTSLSTKNNVSVKNNNVTGKVSTKHNQMNNNNNNQLYSPNSSTTLTINTRNNYNNTQQKVKVKSLLACIRSELMKHHRYMPIFFTTNQNTEDKLFYYKIIRLLTTQTFIIFICGIFLTYQSEIDNHKCDNYTTQNDCLTRKTALDFEWTYCEWVADPTAYFPEIADKICQYKTPVFSTKTLLYILVLSCLLTTVFSVILEHWLKIIFLSITLPETIVSLQQQVLNFRADFTKWFTGECFCRFCVFIVVELLLYACLFYSFCCL